MNEENKCDYTEMEPGLPAEHEDLLIRFLHRIIRHAVRVLAVLMTLAILWGIVDIAWILYQQIIKPPLFLINIEDYVTVLGAFLAILIAIEILINIVLYLRDDVIHVRLVVATALMAIARKVIIFDYKTIAAEHVLATSAVILALGVTYWLITRKPDGRLPDDSWKCR
jgi:uncharacterized membrane protein (DUF373 family)